MSSCRATNEKAAGRYAQALQRLVTLDLPDALTLEDAERLIGSLASER